MRPGVSKTAVDNILKNGNVVPKLETLVKLAGAVDLPFWRVIEMAGLNLGIPPSTASQSQRLPALIEKNPALQDVVRIHAYTTTQPSVHNK